MFFTMVATVQSKWVADYLFWSLNIDENWFKEQTLQKGKPESVTVMPAI